MSLSNSIIQSLRKTVGNSSVLTDPEDLYVYSFEHFFRGKQYPRLDAVVRVESSQQISKVLELAQKEGVQVFRRSEGKTRFQQATSKAIILVDDANPPQLEELLKPDEQQTQKDELEQEIQRSGHGSFRNYALALKSFFSNLPSQKCLTCDVCSGYCPVSPSYNNVETWSSKGRAVLTRGLSAGELQLSPKASDVLYSCSLCGLCFAPCFESTQVRKAILDTRHRIAQKKLTPDLFTATAKNIFEVGDPSGMPPSKRIAWAQQLQHKGAFPQKASVLYWAGCVASTRTPNTAKALSNILNRANVEFTYLGEREGCCGYVLFASGLWNEAKENASVLVERLSQTGAETLITTCAGCYYTFTKMYPEILGVELPCQVQHATQFVEQLIKEKNLILHDLNLKITYHDPCSLGRHSNVYNSPRDVLNAVPKLNFVEMPLSRNRSRCCGAGGGLWSFNNTVAMNCATERLVKDVVPLDVSALATACPTCHINLRNATARKSLGVRVYDIMEIVERATS